MPAGTQKLSEFDENRIIGELLVARGLVTADEITAALYIQSEKPHLRIGEILLSMGLITIEQLDKILREHLSHQFIGSLLLSNDFISQEQLSKAMSVQEKTRRRLGEILIELGYVTEFQLTQLLNKQRLLRHQGTDKAPALERFNKRTKLVATVGPSCANDEMIKAMMIAGVNIFRLNFSHGEHAGHEENIKRIRRIAKELGFNVGILQDIQGPKIRIGEVIGGEVQLIPGTIFKLQTTPVTATDKLASVTYEKLLEDIKPGAAVLIDDGRMELVVEEVSADALITRVKVGGPLRPRKGVNFPGSLLSISVLTEKDKIDLVFGAKHEIDWVAASFVQTANDVSEVKACLKEAGSQTPVIAKIERREAVNSLQEILAVADGVMVARGDLGVECPSEDVPLIQKQIIRQANIAGKPVITATQMLDSMVNAPRPTRAEASDVANAIFDGTDAVMLSNESASGQYPLEAVETMIRIIEKVEKSEQLPSHRDIDGSRQILESITVAATHLASELNAAAIIVPSYSGSTARLVSKFRPRSPIIATASRAAICRQMALLWGVYPLHIKSSTDDESMPRSAIPAAISANLIASGDLIVIMDAVTGVRGRARGVRVEIADNQAKDKEQ